jgi:hypothetical protein
VYSSITDRLAAIHVLSSDFPALVVWWIRDLCSVFRGCIRACIQIFRFSLSPLP